jgi:hypothetical protein
MEATMKEIVRAILEDAIADVNLTDDDESLEPLVDNTIDILRETLDHIRAQSFAEFLKKL